MKRKALVITFLLLSTMLFLIPSESAASFPVAYVPITLTNSQSVATSANFTQLIKVNWSEYASELNANVSNVRFYDSISSNGYVYVANWGSNTVSVINGSTDKVIAAKNCEVSPTIRR